MPLEQYAYGEQYEAPPTLDFSKSPPKYIHPLKRAAVEKILLSDIPDTIEKIIIFGSAITLHYHPQSNLDSEYRLREEESHMWLKTFSSQIGPKDI